METCWGQVGQVLPVTFTMPTEAGLLKQTTSCVDDCTTPFTRYTCTVYKHRFYTHTHTHTLYLQNDRLEIHRVVNIALLVFVTNSIGDTLHVLMQVSAILFICSIDIGIGDTFSFNFWQYSIPILLSSGALVTSVNNSTTVSKS